jgi:hypothetical protein
MEKSFRSYLGSRPVWAAAISYTVVGNLVALFLETMFSTGTAVLTAGLISPLLLAVLIFYLKRYGLETDLNEELVMASTFGAVSAIATVFTVLGSVIFTPSMVFMSLSSLMLAPSIFLTVIGVYHLLELSRDSFPIKELLSVFLAGFLAFAVYKVMIYPQTGGLETLFDFLTGENLVPGLVRSFLMLSAVTLGLHTYTERSKKFTAVMVLVAFGVLSQILGLTGGYLTQLLNPEIPENILLTISWEPVIVAFSGLTYYIVVYMEKISDY